MGVFPAALLLAGLVTVSYWSYLSTRGQRSAILPETHGEPEADPVVLHPMQAGRGRPETVIPVMPGRSRILLLRYTGQAPTGQCRASLHDSVGRESAVETVECGMDTHAFTLPPSIPAGPYVVGLRNANGIVQNTYAIRVTR
ncbi:MAG TPA: hypothetical protein VFQ91_08960 [Bryobacteraceae bacterium]|nr:hypothetical protein [Bryobacteraceae bacterium]